MSGTKSVEALRVSLKSLTTAELQTFWEDHPVLKAKVQQSLGSGSLHATIRSDEIEEPERIGGGGFGTVVRAKWHGNNVAVKYIRSKKLQGSKLQKSQVAFCDELLTLKECRHPNILLLMGWNVDEPGNFFLVTELMDKGSLKDCLENDSDGDFAWNGYGKKLAEDALTGLRFLHTLVPAKAHFDIKPSNILITGTPPLAKLGDVGLTKAILPDLGMARAGGTPGYLSPEVAETGQGTSQSDIFSFGVVLFDQLMHHAPVFADAVEKAKHPDRSGQPDVSRMLSMLEMPDAQCPPALLGLVRVCLLPGPLKRPTSSALLDGVLGLQQFAAGMKVRVVKVAIRANRYPQPGYSEQRSSQWGNTALVLNPHWQKGLVRVKMLSGSDTGQLKSYQGLHLAPVDKGGLPTTKEYEAHPPESKEKPESLAAQFQQFSVGDTVKFMLKGSFTSDGSWKTNTIESGAHHSAQWEDGVIVGADAYSKTFSIRYDDSEAVGGESIVHEVGLFAIRTAAQRERDVAEKKASLQRKRDADLALQERQRAARKLQKEAEAKRNADLAAQFQQFSVGDTVKFMLKGSFTSFGSWKTNTIESGAHHSAQWEDGVIVGADAYSKTFSIRYDDSEAVGGESIVHEVGLFAIRTAAQRERDVAEKKASLQRKRDADLALQKRQRAARKLQKEAEAKRNADLAAQFSVGDTVKFMLKGSFTSFGSWKTNSIESGAHHSAQWEDGVIAGSDAASGTFSILYDDPETGFVEILSGCSLGEHFRTLTQRELADANVRLELENDEQFVDGLFKVDIDDVVHTAEVPEPPDGSMITLPDKTKVYAHFVLAQVHPDLHIDRTGLDSVAEFLGHALATIIPDLSSIKPEDLMAALREVHELGEVGKHAISEGKKAMLRFKRSCEERSREPRNKAAGLTFGVDCVTTTDKGAQLSDNGDIFLTAILEYFANEVIELAGNQAKYSRKLCISRIEVAKAIELDDELKQLQNIA